MVANGPYEFGKGSLRGQGLGRGQGHENMRYL